MDEAAAMARDGDPGRVWIIADRQTGGRGRRGRTWVSEPGNLYATLLLVDPSPTAVAPQLGFVAGLALRDALAPYMPSNHAMKLKWPNDVLVDGAKIAGILLEGLSLAVAARRQAVMIGIGVNVAHHPDLLPYAANDLASLGCRISPLDLMCALSDAFVPRLEQWRSGAAFAMTRASWLDAAAGLGEAISVQLHDRLVAGIFSGLDQNGRLIVETEAGVQAIDAGDVMLRRKAA
jgi:BirA family biotin operon repressor/biotin-[acetyl-CoA-carboxylase] ligase